ncbi:MAG: ORF6N domain-containing protein, partial [Rectinemataceae bacterium]|nr:ORF6N domain-containing protein [Rectinemataceae bacterium]
MRQIYLIRGHKFILDRDLAEMYGVSTKRLNEQVKRNPKRFPLDFMFRFSKAEMEKWRSQFA